MRNLRSGIFGSLAIALILGGCSFFGGEEENSGDPLAAHKANVARQVDTVMRRLEALRGLTFQRPVHSQVITRAQFCRQVAQEVRGNTPDSILRAVSREFAQWGFFPDTTYQFTNEVVNQQCYAPVGYYSLGSDTIFVLSEFALRDSVLFTTIPHELEHALQDQHFPDFMRGVGALDSGVYAMDFHQYRSCVSEGEAAFMENLYTAYHILGRPMDSPDSMAVEGVRHRKRITLDEWKTWRPPEVLDISFLGRYNVGGNYIGEAYLSAGFKWDRVNSFFREMNHPSVRILDTNVRVAVPINLNGVLDTTGSVTDDAALGAFDLMAVVAQDLDSAGYYSGLGWRGDRFVYSRDQWGSLVWVGVFDGDSSAAKYAGQLERALKRRFDGDSGTLLPVDSNFTLTLTASQKHWSHPGLRTAVVVAGPEVWLLEGSPRNWSSSLMVLESGWATRRLLPKAGFSASHGERAGLPLWKSIQYKSRFLPVFEKSFYSRRPGR
jgi:hypothetical protein